MAIRRMFSGRIVTSAKFLKMPISSQALYFHLGIEADDDGIVEAYNVLNSVGCTEDDLRVLVAKGFVRVLNEDLVTYITDWRENNNIRADRKVDSIYKDLLLEIVPDAKLLEKKQRSDIKGTSGQSTDSPRTDNGRSMDGIGKDSIGKDSIGKDKKDRGHFVPPSLEELTEYIRENGYHVNPESFLSFYESKGWLVGKTKMKDWKAAVRNWEQRSKQEQAKPSKPTQFHFDGQRASDYYDDMIKKLEGGA